MKNKLTVKLLSLLTAILIAFPLVSPGLAFAAVNHENEGKVGKISSQLLDEFQDDKEKTTFLVTFKEKPNVEQAAEKALSVKGMKSAGLSELKKVRNTAVVSELKNTSENAQKKVVELLAKEQEAGNVDKVKSHYIVNTVVVTATKEVAEKLEGFEEVESILPNKTRYLHISEEDETITATADKIAWNVKKIKAPEVWEQGIDGTGIVVATIDSGVEWNHPALKKNYRGYDAETGEVDHAYNWYDAVSNKAEPYDNIDHGTHVTGTMVGSEKGKEQIGVAPGAKWIAVRAFDNFGHASDEDLIEAAEWILSPRDENGVERPDLAPDIVNNSWGSSSGFDEFYRDIVKAWVAAGIFPVFSAGNAIEKSDVVPGSVEVPANYPESFAVGAVDADNLLAPFSLIGPSPYNEIKPDISAPGVGINSSVLNGKYAKKDGTSMASPAVSGMVALLYQAAPELSIDEIKQVIKASATPLKDKTYTSVPNNGYGYGLINAEAAVAAAKKEENRPINRISGYLRYDTAIEISRKGWDTADTVVLARGDDFADALTGAPLAVKLDVPILLTGTNKLYAGTLREIKRLRTTNVVILGGTEAVSDNVVSALIDEGFGVRRINGSSRTETAELIAKEVAPNGTEQAFVVNGYDFPDALSAAAYAAKRGVPILISQAGKLPQATKSSIESLGIKETLVIGGEKVVAESVKDQLPSATRVSGSDRYETNTLLADYFDINYDYMYVATGKNFADVLTGSVLAAKNNTGILLVHDRVPKNTPSFISKNDVNRLTIFGGKTAVSDTIKNELESLIQ